MRRNIVLAGACILLAAALTACVPTAETKVAVDPYLGETKNVRLDYEELYNDMVESFGDGNENPYSYITDINMRGDDEKQTIDFMAYCIDGISKEEAEQFAAAVLRRANDAAVGQSSEFKPGNRNSFGTLWDKYSFTFKIIPDSSKLTGDNAVLDLAVRFGEEIPLNPDIETYEDEWIEQRDIIRENMVYDVNGNVVFY